MRISELSAALQTEHFLARCQYLYAAKAQENQARYQALLSLFQQTFPEDLEAEGGVFSAPGRTEIGGNHTDHQHGRVLAASVDMDTVAVAARTHEPRIRVLSEGYPLCTIDCTDLSVKEEERNSTAALIRGVAAGFAQRGCQVGGLDVVCTSSVLPGSGISSSAAFEVLMGNVINGLYFQETLDAIAIAQIGQYAENVYFGKPSGLMDQMASSVGNVLTIDFQHPARPVVRQLDVDFEHCGLALCIIDSGADHADLTDEYAAIPHEMKQICSLLGQEVLRQVDPADFFRELPRIRPQVGDRALLRAFHFFADNERVPRQAEALEKGDVDTFLRLVRESGHSSWMYLQNILVIGSKAHQEMGLALALCEQLLGERGAYRVHGGGFAGTVQAFVPLDLLEQFCAGIDGALGQGSCHVLSIRPVGGLQVI